jgi:hypothetical protein
VRDNSPGQLLPVDAWPAYASRVASIASPAFWLGRLLLSGKVTVAAHSPATRGETA